MKHGKQVSSQTLGATRIFLYSICYQVLFDTSWPWRSLKTNLTWFRVTKNSIQKSHPKVIRSLKSQNHWNPGFCSGEFSSPITKKNSGGFFALSNLSTWNLIEFSGDFPHSLGNLEVCGVLTLETGEGKGNYQHPQPTWRKKNLRGFFFGVNG